MNFFRIDNPFCSIPTYVHTQWPVLGSFCRYKSDRPELPIYPCIVLSTDAFFCRRKGLKIREAVLAHETIHALCQRPRKMRENLRKRYNKRRELDCWQRALVLLYKTNSNKDSILYALYRLTCP